MTEISILLPPSESKAEGGDGAPWAPDTLVLPELDVARARVLKALGARSPVAASPTMPAAQRYTGVLYRELAPLGLPARLRRRFDAQALTISGLWGVVAPADPIPYYKLKMSAPASRLGKLSTWWRPRLTKALSVRLAGHVVWDLLPLEHSAAWVPAQVPYAQRATVRFVGRDDKTVSHWNKLLKGALVRHLLEAQVTDPADLGGFDHPLGYRFDPLASDLASDPAVVVFRQR